MDVDYIDGVFDKDGKKVIRALTDDEKAWLNQFYIETVNANLNHNQEARKLTSKITEITKELKKNPSAYLEEELTKAIDARKTAYKASNFYSEPKEHKKIYDENNARNRCVLNRLKGILEEIDAQVVDKYGTPATALERLIHKEDLEQEIEDNDFIEKLVDDGDE